MVYLMRHPRVAVTPAVCYGRTDVALANTQDITAAAHHPDLQDLSVIYTSPSSRCAQVAQALAKAANSTLEIDTRLQELDFGCWEGKAWEDIDRQEIMQWAQDLWNYAPGHGESLALLWQRVEEFFAATGLNSIRQDATQKVLIISHQGVLRALHAIAQGLNVEHYFKRSFPFGFAGLTTL
jgi:alpha-ribazole phosphatase